MASIVPSKKIMSKLGKTNAEFELIEEGDKVLVGLSGGKDSLTMIHAMKEQLRRAPFKFEFLAVTVGYGMGENFDELVKHCKEYDIPHIVHHTNTYALAEEKIRKNSSFCSFFSRMRRGYLYSVALENGCNKVALGHHLDDASESFFMNFIYNGQMRSLAPKYKAENGDLVLLYCIHFLVLHYKGNPFSYGKRNYKKMSFFLSFLLPTHKYLYRVLYVVYRILYNA